MSEWRKNLMDKEQGWETCERMEKEVEAYGGEIVWQQRAGTDF